MLQEMQESRQIWLPFEKEKRRDGGLEGFRMHAQEEGPEEQTTNGGKHPTTKKLTENMPNRPNPIPNPSQ
jgi:hypothetical protein